jgi:hypothetical protein
MRMQRAGSIHGGMLGRRAGALGLSRGSAAALRRSSWPAGAATTPGLGALRRATSAARSAPVPPLAGAAAAQPVVLLGHPALRVVCEDCGGDELVNEKAALVATLEAFRERNGFGRG